MVSAVALAALSGFTAYLSLPYLLEYTCRTDNERGKRVFA